MPPAQQHRFSARTAWDTSESPLAHAVREARAAGHSLPDLTLSNPTRCGFTYDSEAILAALQNPGALVYDPDPRGISVAREAVSLYYSGHYASVDPDRMLLTTSTSEAYSFLFRLLCNSGDAVLVAQPSYPLFDFLADIDDVTLEPYPLFHDYGWWIDFAELERRITPRTRAILLVHPNNPTGHATSPSERERLEALCVRHGLALIVDEVFLDYGLSADPASRIQTFATGPHPCLTFAVSGLSKIAALPQMKVAWIAVFGPEALRREALGRLEMIADTYLSMNAPAQHALPVWLAGSEPIRRQIIARVRENLAAVEDAGGGTISTLPVEAGWSAILRLPQTLVPTSSPESLALSLVHEAGVIVHPASFYGMPGSHRIVVSLLGPADHFRRGLEKLNAWCGLNCIP